MVILVGSKFSLSAGHGLISPAIMQRDEDRPAIFTGDVGDDEFSSSTSFTTFSDMVSRTSGNALRGDTSHWLAKTSPPDNTPGNMAPSIPIRRRVLLSKSESWTCVFLAVVCILNADRTHHMPEAVRCTVHLCKAISNSSTMPVPCSRLTFDHVIVSCHITDNAFENYCRCCLMCYIHETSESVDVRC